MLRRPVGALLASLALVSVWSTAAATEPEDELKSAVVLSFLRYSEWPDAAEGAITIGVVGRSSLMGVFRRTLEGKAVGGRTIRIVDWNPALDPRCCHVIYVASGKAAEIKLALLAAHSPHALTIGESDRFLECGGAVNLLQVDGRMSFEVSLAAIGRSGVSISSTLLRFGHILDAGKGRPPA